MAWNRLEFGSGKGRRSSVTPVQNVGIQDDKILLKEIGYTLLKKIGHGSFSKVWKARNANWNIDIAIKIIRKRKASKEFLEKFLPRELDIIQKIRHPNLLKYYEISQSPTSVYIVMQYAENGTLADLIERQKRISEEMSKIFFLQLTDVVEFLHRRGIVHRDIKCENLLLEKTYKLLLSDFGFARGEVTPGVDGRIQRSRTYCGSYAYASPEILSNTPYNPFLADVWCMGMVLYNMIVGTIPYRQTDIKALIAAKKHPPSFPSDAQVPEETQTFIKRMLALETNRASIPQLRKDPWMSSKFDRKKGELSRSKPTERGASTSHAPDDEGSAKTVDVATSVQTLRRKSKEVRVRIPRGKGQFFRRMLFCPCHGYLDKGWRPIDIVRPGNVQPNTHGSTTRLHWLMG